MDACVVRRERVAVVVVEVFSNKSEKPADLRASRIAEEAAADRSSTVRSLA